MAKPTSLDSFRCRRNLTVGDRTYAYYSLSAASAALGDLARLPFSLKVLLENLLRHEDGRTTKADDIRGVLAWLTTKTSELEIAFRPARVLMQDFTGVPAVVDLAAMRDATAAMGADAKRVNPLIPVDLVIDHSVIVDKAGSDDALAFNTAREFERNAERYRFLRWGQDAFENFRVVPPGTGICHQVNLEYLAQTVWVDEGGNEPVAYPDSLVGTDSHTTMVNAIAVLGWGVGGIEAEAAMLGQPISMLLPDVVGVRLKGALKEGVTATDLVLTVTQALRRHGVVNKFVEFFGPGLAHISAADRATLANMAPEYGATCGFFPVDDKTLDYLRVTGREEHRVALVEAYCKAQGLFRLENMPDPVFTSVLEVDLSAVQPSIAGPRRPQDRVLLGEASSSFAETLTPNPGKAPGSQDLRHAVIGKDFSLGHGDVVIAAITSCTNTSNPSVMMGAGLLAKKAVERGLSAKPWVKASLAPGSQVVQDYLQKAGVDKHLSHLGFQVVGYGCTTCIGNSGPLADEISQTINDSDLTVAAVLSGNRNFEGRINPDIKANYLASPPLVVAYAIAGTMKLDLTKDPLGKDAKGEPVYLRDIWPTNAEIESALSATIDSNLFRARYNSVFAGDIRWQAIDVASGMTYAWKPGSTYIQNPPYFEGMTDGLNAKPKPIADIVGARVLGLFLDSITTDHISPAGSIKPASPAGFYLTERQVSQAEFNAYGARRGNHEVMVRGTFANSRIKNQMVKGVEGGITTHQPSGERMPIFDAAMRYQAENVPLVVFAGKEYGTGSSRDWAAKGTKLLGIRAVVVESFERIHRSNLVGMGVLPLVFEQGTSWQSLGITGAEVVTLRDLAGLKPRAKLQLEITFPDGRTEKVPVTCRIDTLDELEYYRNDGILPYMLRRMVS